MGTFYRVVEADLERDMPAIAGLISRVFAGGEYADEIAREYVGNCNYDPRVTRLVWDGERLAHHWGVWGYEMRMESALLRVAGIGAVATDEAYRKQGLMERAARASFEAMLEAGYDLSILRGRHYVKYGYERAWNYVTYRLGASHGAEIPSDPPQPYRALQAADFAALTALYNREYAAFSGSAVRPTYRAFKSEGLEASYYGWFGADGSLAGFVRALPGEGEDSKHLLCLEAAGDPQQCLVVLGELFRKGQPPDPAAGAEAERKPFATLSFFTLPHLHPLLQRIRRGACLVETQYFGNTGWRVRLVNLGSTLEKLRPLLEARLRRSHLAGWQGTLRLEAEALTGHSLRQAQGTDASAGSATVSASGALLEIDRGQVTLRAHGESENILRGGAALARLLIGSDDPAEVIRQEGMQCHGAAAELAEVLFPNLYPMLSHWDEF
ncbi:MAG TPA: GNAT family N-acetyltransferase [Anaerolineaceae bacterium]|nr:GNAT family N-acetyltransferase [Anaerolineaceae bacterium]